MKAKMINDSHIEGYLYDHKLALKVSGEKSKNPGIEFINGTISIATDNALTNIVDVHYTYVTATTSTGKPNSSFGILKNIIDGKTGTVMANGKENAAKLRVDSTIGVNDFVTERDGVETVVAAKRNEGGFIHTTDMLADDEKARATFTCDMVIENVSHVDANPERNLPEKAVIKGYAFDFRKALVPVEFSATAPNAISYFEGLDASARNPVFTKVWGRQISETIVRKIEEESAFGDANVREVKSSRKDWVVTGASSEPYVWDDASTITADEMVTAKQNREMVIAETKQRYYDQHDISKSVLPETSGFKF